jgi:hypothetical protein
MQRILQVTHRRDQLPYIFWVWDYFFIVFLDHLYNKFTCDMFVSKLKVNGSKRGQSVRPSGQPEAGCPRGISLWPLSGLQIISVCLIMSPTWRWLSNLLINPFSEVRNIGVDSKLITSCTTYSIRDYSKQGCSFTSENHERSSRVTLACVTPTFDALGTFLVTQNRYGDQGHDQASHALWLYATRTIAT